MQEKLISGYYSRVGTDTTSIFNDYSVGTVTVSDSASSVVDIRSGPDSGTNSYSVGAVNTTTVNSSGTNNNIKLESSADSTGCQDGSIMMMVPAAGAELNIADGESLTANTSTSGMVASEVECG